MCSGSSTWSSLNALCARHPSSLAVRYQLSRFALLTLPTPLIAALAALQLVLCSPCVRLCRDQDEERFGGLCQSVAHAAVGNGASSSLFLHWFRFDVCQTACTASDLCGLPSTRAAMVDSTYPIKKQKSVSVLSAITGTARRIDLRSSLNLNTLTIALLLAGSVGSMLQQQLSRRHTTASELW